jgi:ankyrin repeat protein
LAWDVWLRGVIPKSNELAIRSLLHHSDFVEDQNFPLVHKIILGLSLRSLDDELGDNPQAPFERDAQGRTALSWAACRGDALSCAKLLARGADANALDKHLKSPLYLAVNSEHITQNDCVRVLLEGGAETDPILHNSGVVRSTPLLCAANEADDILVLKTLIDFGADIEARNRTGATPLLIVARRKPVTFAALLLAYGANVHARDKSGKSVLATCIAHNNHDVLRLLLDRWFRYTACPRLRNLGILHVAAEHADLETMKTLIIAGHWGLHADTRNAQGLTAEEMMRKRADKTPELERAYARLIRAVQNAPTYADKSRMMEAGLLQPQQAGWLKSEHLPDQEEFEENGEEGDEEGDEEDQFEEAAEFFSYV